MSSGGSVALEYSLDGPEDAPVLVLGPSLGTTRAMWDAQLSSLVGPFRVLRYEHRGHGASEAPPGPYGIADLGGDVLALLDRLGLERVSYCGVSLGGMVGMWLASEAPERVESLVLCCTSARLGPAEEWDRRAAVARADGVGALAGAVVERWFTPALRERDPDLVARFEAMLAAVPGEGYAGCCEAIRDLDLRERLASIRAPTLVIAGSEDPATPPEHGELIRASIPGARMRVLDGAAHLANVEQPAAVSRAVLEHLGAAAPAGTGVRRQVLGDRHVDAAVDRTTDFTREFQDLITRYAWGEVWTRPGLDRRTRSAITVTALVAGGHPDELALHVRAALRNGLSEDEIKEVLLQSAIYCGVPAANSAFAIAQRVLGEEGAG